MSASLHVRGLAVYRGPQLVLDDISINLAPGHRVGLVGPNGVGKSTLLAVLADELEPDAGSVDRVPTAATVGLLPQEHPGSDTETVNEFLRRRVGVTAAQHALDSATHMLAAAAPGADEAYAIAFDRWMSLGAADLEARIGETWAELGLEPGLLTQPTATLSGGEAARCSLASLLLSRFDVYLLDEPTNDLDLESLARLEAWTLGLSSPLLMVSHDREFLRRTISDVFELDFHSHRGAMFSGGWDSYLVERERAAALAEELFDNYRQNVATLNQQAQQQREWFEQGRSKNRKSGENDKIARNFQIAKTEKLQRKAARVDEAVERLEVVEKPRVKWELHLTIPDAGRSGNEVAWAREAVVSRGGFQLGPVTMSINYGDKVALLGPNGSGKSTLINLLLARLECDSGSAGLGPSVVVGEIEQTRAALGGDAPLGESFQLAAGLSRSDTRTLLAKFGLAAEHVQRPADTLSPGERTRASLALLMANGANFLVLDEPTNHLDIEAIEQLEQALETFTGTVLLVTHDRALLDGVTITRTLQADNGEIIELY